MIDLYYSLVGSIDHYGIRDPSLDNLRKLGFKVVDYEPLPQTHCWYVRVEDFDFELPGYICKLKNPYWKFDKRKDI